MITIDKGTDKKLLVLTNPNCGVCRELFKDELCQQFPLTKILLLAPFSKADETILQLILKTKDPYATYEMMMKGEDFNFDYIDINKDISEIWFKNLSLFDSIMQRFKVQGTPAFFLLDENDIILEQIKLEMNPSEVLKYKISKILNPHIFNS